MPNPASSFATIKLPTTLERATRKQVLRCYDAKGAMAAEIPWGDAAQEQQLDVGKWPPGAYQLLFWNGNRPQFSGKIIVQH